MNKPTHAEIAARAYHLWQESGPTGGDAIQNWLDAERQLSNPAATSPSAATPPPETASRRPLGESNRPEAAAERAAQQKKEARAPQFQTHSAPKPSTPETGKPLWNQPHSS